MACGLRAFLYSSICNAKSLVGGGTKSKRNEAVVQNQHSGGFNVSTRNRRSLAAPSLLLFSSSSPRCLPTRALSCHSASGLASAGTMVVTLNSNPSCDHSKDTDGLPESRQIGDRLPSDSWHIDAVLPPNAEEMVYEDLQPVADSIQGNGKSVEKRHALDAGR